MSNINRDAAANLRDSTITGPAILQMFENLQTQMEVSGAQGVFTQMSFCDEAQNGDLIPEISFSLRAYWEE